MTSALLARLAKAGDDYDLPLQLVKEDTVTGTVIVHDASGFAVFDTMTKLPTDDNCDFDDFIIEAINHAPAMAREVAARRDEQPALRAAKALLAHSLKDIAYRYDGLTKTERSLCSREDFDALAAWIRVTQ